MKALQDLGSSKQNLDLLCIEEKAEEKAEEKV